MAKKRIYKSPLRRAVEEKERKRGVCRWFLKCDAPAVTTVTHPTLGEVPCCARHAKFARGE